MKIVGNGWKRNKCSSGLWEDPQGLSSPNPGGSLGKDWEPIFSLSLFIVGLGEGATLRC